MALLALPFSIDRYPESFFFSPDLTFLHRQHKMSERESLLKKQQQAARVRSGSGYGTDFIDHSEPAPAYQAPRSYQQVLCMCVCVWAGAFDVLCEMTKCRRDCVNVNVNV